MKHTILFPFCRNADAGLQKRSQFFDWAFLGVRNQFLVVHGLILGSFLRGRSEKVKAATGDFVKLAIYHAQIEQVFCHDGATSDPIRFVCFTEVSRDFVQHFVWKSRRYVWLSFRNRRSISDFLVCDTASLLALSFEFPVGHELMVMLDEGLIDISLGENRRTTKARNRVEFLFQK